MSGPTGGGEPVASPTPAGQPPAQAPGPAAAPNPAMTAMRGAWAKMSWSDQLLAGGALLVLIGGAWLFGAILQGNGVASWVLVASAELVLAVWIRNWRSQVSWVLSYGLVISGLVVSVGVTELNDLLVAVFRGGLTGESAVDLLGDLCAWVGAGLMSWGAYEYWRHGGS